MNKLLAVFSLLALAGAGCLAPQADVSVDSETEVEADVSGDEMNNDVDMDVEVEAEGEVEVGDVEEVDPNAGIELMMELNINMDSGNFYFKPETITAKAGQTVNVKIVSNGGFHTLVIDAIDLKETVKAGETITFTAPTAPGSYEFYCDVGSHRAMGMTGTLIVE